MNHRRGKPKKQRGHAGQGCAVCYYQKHWKMNGAAPKDKYRPSERRRIQEGA